MEQEDRFMIIKMGREHYGIKINDIKEIVPNTEITDAPDKQSVYICGILKCRYGCVSVFDIYRLFHVKPVSLSKIVIILTMGEKLLAFSTESVDFVINVSPKNIFDIPSIFHNTNQRYMQSVILSDNHLIPIIDTASLFEKAGVLEKLG